MIILEFQGGLGNQMFQYAMYLLLKKRGINVKCKTSENKENDRPFDLYLFQNVSIETDDEKYNQLVSEWNKRSIFRRGYEKIFKEKRIYFLEDETLDYDERIFKLDNKILSGYFQSLDYISLVEKELRDAFTFPKVEEKLKTFIKELPENAISLHIRRGDYLKWPEIYGGICTEKYYERAINYFKEKGLNNFVVFSNDPEWVRGNFALENALYVEGTIFDEYKDWYDMYIMSHCPNNILANSTFSWWAAWLNTNENRIVVSPPRIENLHPNKHLQEDDWVIISGD